MQALIQQIVLCRKIPISAKPEREVRTFEFKEAGKIRDTVHVSDNIVVHHLVTSMHTG